MKKLEHVKAKALKLREKNKTLDEIANMLKVSRTTVYYWIKDLPIERTSKQSMAQAKGTEAVKLKYSKLRDKAYNDGLKMYPKLKKEKTFIDFVTIYLTEGYRKNRNVVSVCNSNLSIVLISLYWIKKLNFNNKKIKFRVQMHADQDELIIKKYWSSKLDINLEDIIISRKSNSGKLKGRNWRSEHGVISIDMLDTYLRSRIQSFMDLLEKDWLIKIKRG